MSTKKNKRGLGRGLGALIQPEVGPVNAEDSTENVSQPAEKLSEEASQGAPAGGTNAQAGNSGVAAGTRSRPSDLFFETSREQGQDQRRDRYRRPSMPNPLAAQRETSGSQRTGSLDGEQSVPVSDSRLVLLDLEQVTPNRQQPRQEFDEDELQELVASIREVGVLQPIVVREIGESTYELIMGERRFRASRLAGLSSIPAVIRDASDDRMLVEALVENIHRSDLNPLEEAAAYEQLLKDFGWSQEQLSKNIGKSRPAISNSLRLMQLPASVQSKVAARVLSSGHARALLGAEDPAVMEIIADRVVSEGLSVRATEELVSLYRSRKPHARRSVSRGTQTFDDLAAMFSDELDTTVDIRLGAKKGRISIDFASVEDLNRIMALIQPSQRQ
ncbi:ParB/RepB/Spo0J family partition protein [Auritidibacter ignavus]|uniref:ParB/RepB/Spo0J family partition protein n=1 Tax=Auritidibacter ignavus TaxID=678932 RepID=UPI00244CB35D|nr:ParB/RepB/Spo0J family partition protein [Auritidibacter ignavus]WGH83293.1 ParB/RepB/Spo0J family partition protein [Auritidibacter ignavus]